jgi:hypothetical protein
MLETGNSSFHFKNSSVRTALKKREKALSRINL